MKTKEWAEIELAKIDNKEENIKDFLNFIIYGKTKTLVKVNGTIKSLNPNE